MSVLEDLLKLRQSMEQIANTPEPLRLDDCLAHYDAILRTTAPAVFTEIMRRINESGGDPASLTHDQLADLSVPVLKVLDFVALHLSTFSRDSGRASVGKALTVIAEERCQCENCKARRAKEQAEEPTAPPPADATAVPVSPDTILD